MSTVNPRYSLPLSKYKRKPTSLPLSEEYPLNALSFDGVNDGVYIPTNKIFNLNEFTLVTVVKMFKKPDEYSVFIAGKQGQYWFEWRSSSFLSLSMKFSDLTYNGVGFSVNLADGKVHVLTMTYDGTTKKGYLDGELKSTNTIGKTVNTTTTPFKVGNKYVSINTNYNACFYGISYLTILYSKALSNSEIKQLSKNPYNPPLSSCVLWLSPDNIDESAGVWYDKSGNNLNGTIYGAKKVKLQQYEVSL